jgi:hypothetical protein
MPDRTITTLGWTEFAVPKGVKWVWVTLNGAGSAGRRGGRVEGRVNVEGTAKLLISCGGQGQAPSGVTGGRGGLPGDGGDGGNGGPGMRGGYGGGGATVIRAGSVTGAIKAVAGGAGGQSGDYGLGGRGGDEVGEAGTPAPGYPGGFQPDEENYPNLWDYPAIGNATGGTQIQGGNRGTSSAGAYLDGTDAPDVVLAKAGKGGGGRTSTYGGGGGGGGYFPGGGGQGGASLLETPGGGGGGGSNYTQAVVGATSLRGEGATGNGSVLLSWDSPGKVNQPPTPPTEPKNGDNDIPEGGEPYETLSTNQFTISAKLNAPEKNQKVRLIAKFSTDQTFRNGAERQVTSAFVKSGKRASVTLTGLVQDSLYYVRLYTQDKPGLVSRNYNAITLWTNRRPLEPEITGPGHNSTLSELSTVVFEWNHRDPDATSSQSAFRLRWRRKATPAQKAGPWTWARPGSAATTEHTNVVWDDYWTEAPGTFKANTAYEWQVATRDQQLAWGPYSQPHSFYVEGETAPPVLLGPREDEAVNISEPVAFTWMFRDPTDWETQGKADLRYRPAADQSEQENWITLLGDPTLPGSTQAWVLPADALSSKVRYEWQVRTYDSVLSDPSDWSDSEFFWTVDTPRIGAPELLLASGIDTALGCGTHRVFVYDRGGLVMRGEITPLSTV